MSLRERVGGYVARTRSAVEENVERARNAFANTLDRFNVRGEDYKRLEGRFNEKDLDNSDLMKRVEELEVQVVLKDAQLKDHSERANYLQEELSRVRNPDPHAVFKSGIMQLKKVAPPGYITVGPDGLIAEVDDHAAGKVLKMSPNVLVGRSYNEIVSEWNSSYVNKVVKDQEVLLTPGRRIVGFTKSVPIRSGIRGDSRNYGMMVRVELYKHPTLSSFLERKVERDMSSVEAERMAIRVDQDD